MKQNLFDGEKTSLGLVQQLRWVFVLMISVFGVAILLAVWQFQSLREKQFELLHSSVPVLVLAQSIESTFSEIIIKIDDIERAPSLAALNPMRQEVQARFQGAKDSVRALQFDPKFIARSSRLLDKVDEMETSLQRNFEIKERLLTINQSLEALRVAIAKDRSDLRRELDEIAFHASLRVDSTISDVVASRNRSLEELRQNLSSQTEEVALVGQLALEFEAIAGVLNQLDNKESLQRISKARNFLEFRLRGAISSMVYISNPADRTIIAEKVGAIKNRIFSDEGFLGQLENAAHLSVELNLQNSVRRNIASAVSKATEDLVGSARGYLIEVGSLTEKTTQKIIVILSIAAIFTILIAIFAVYFILERQINRRLSQLTDAVLRIASGDNDVPIDVSGHDELGHMARALIVFKRNARELTQSNAELEKFAYVAAHDLRSPLQAILDLIEWTIEDDETEVSEATAKNLRLIQSRASRLQMLLSDLLEYARTEDGTSFPEITNPHNLILDVWRETKGSQNFELVLDCHVDEVCTYPDPLRKVVQNLFENSIQHHVSEVGKIDVRVFEQSNRLWMEVADDGPGIPPMYHKKIFELFQTLKARDVVEASGLGLAICMKIIKQFDGDFRLESDPELKKGSTFIFDFPIEVIVPRRQAA